VPFIAGSEKVIRQRMSAILNMARGKQRSCLNVSHDFTIDKNRNIVVIPCSKCGPKKEMLNDAMHILKGGIVVK